MPHAELAMVEAVLVAQAQVEALIVVSAVELHKLLAVLVRSIPVLCEALEIVLVPVPVAAAERSVDGAGTAGSTLR